MNRNSNIPYFATDIPFEVVYRKSSTSTPVMPHTHNALELYFTLTDLPDVLLNDTVSGVDHGSLIVIPPHCIHQLFNQKLTVYERYIITVNSNWLNAVLDSDSTLMPYSASSASPVAVRLSASQVAVFKSMLDAFVNTEYSRGMARYSDFFALLNLVDTYITGGLSRRSPKALSITEAQRRINEIIAYINRHLTEPLDMDTIAGEFHLNRDYLGRIFKEHTQATVGHYISVQRAGLACSLLAEGHSVSEVQDALGFSSYAYFSKFFKKMTGVCPGHYRKS